MRFLPVLLVLLLPASPGDTLYVDPSHPDASDRNPGTDDAPLKTLGAAARKIKGGDTVIVMPGVYRESVAFSASGRPDRPTVIRTSEKHRAIVTGADVVTGWERTTPLVHRSAETFQKPEDSEKKADGELDQELGAVGRDLEGLSKEHAATRKKQETYERGMPSIWVKKDYPYHVMSYYPPHRFEQVILDGRPLTQVLRQEEMVPGTFYCGAKGLYVWPWVAPESGGEAVPDNWWEDLNQGHTVEVSRRVAALTVRGDFIHVRGFIFRYGVNQAQWSLAGGSGRGVVFEDCIAEHSGGTGIGLSGEGVVLRRVIARYNGNKGATTGFCWNGLWEDVELAYNNTKGFSALFECGGTKCCGQRDGVFRRVHAHHNNAPGIWLDIDNRDCLFEDCWANDNNGPGFVAEISQGITWRNCVSIRNRSGIGIWESFGCTIEHCTLVDNPVGIAVRGGSLGGARALTGWPRRDTSIAVPYQVRDLTIRNNLLAYNGTAISMANHPDDLKVLDGNLYWPAWGAGTPVCWVGGLRTLDELRSAGYERTGRVGPPLFVDRLAENFRLRPESPAAALGQPLLDVTTDRDGKARDRESPSAGAWELPRSERKAVNLSETQAVDRLRMFETVPVRTESGLELHGDAALSLSWQQRLLVRSDHLSIVGEVPRPGWGKTIWDSGTRSHPGGEALTAEVVSPDGKGNGFLSTWNEREIVLATRQAALPGDRAVVWYHVRVPSDSPYRPVSLQAALTLPGEVYGDAAFRLEDDQGKAIEGQRLRDAPPGTRTVLRLHFDLPEGAVVFDFGRPYQFVWNARELRGDLLANLPIDANRGLDVSWCVQMTVRNAR